MSEDDAIDQYDDILRRFPQDANHGLGDVELGPIPRTREDLTGAIREPPLLGGTHNNRINHNVASEMDQLQQEEPLVEGEQTEHQGDTEQDDNGWNPQIEKVMRSIAKKAYLNRQLHDFMSNESARRARTFKFSLMGISFASNIFSFLPSLINSPWDPVPLMAKTLSSVVTAMTVANSIVEFDKLTELHRQAERKYLELYQQLQQQLLISDPKLRINGIKFMQLAMNSHTAVQTKAPPIPKKIINLWRTKSSQLLGEEGDEFRDVTITVSPEDVPILRRIESNGRESWVIQIDPISQLTLQEIIDANAMIL